MKQIPAKEFLKGEFDPDTVVAMRVANGEYYFLAHMENAEEYRIKQLKNSNGEWLNTLLMLHGEVNEAIYNIDGYNDMYILYETENCVPIREADKAFKNEFDKFLSLYNFDAIFELSKYDFKDLTLKDGNYVFVITDMNYNTEGFYRHKGGMNHE